MKLVIVNSFSKGSHHEIFNAAICKVCALCNYDIVFYSDKETAYKYKALGEIEFRHKLNLKGLYTFAQNNRFSLLLSYLWGTLINLFILISSKPKDTIIFLFNNSFSIYLLNKINLLLKRNVIVYCHGELEMLISSSNNSRGILAKMIRSLLIYFFSRKTHSLKLVVMGDSIKRNLLTYLSDTEMLIYAVDHPYIFLPKSSSNENNKTNCLSLGTVGSLSKSKGSDEYLQLIRLFKSVNLKANFSIIGKLFEDKLPFEQLGVMFPCEQYHMCPRSVFNKLISQLDYILFFYPVDSYKLTASGAIYDSIANEIPIISLKNDYFNYLFDKYGRFGYLFDSIDQIFLFISNDLPYINEKIDFSKIKTMIEPNNFLHETQLVINDL